MLAFVLVKKVEEEVKGTRELTGGPLGKFSGLRSEAFPSLSQESQED